MTSLPQAILFDWDNTLVTSKGLIEECLNATFLKFNKEQKSQEELEKTAFYSSKDLFSKWFNDCEKEALQHYYELIQSKHLTYVTLKSGSYELLSWIRDKNIPCALISNKRPDLLKKEVELLKVDHFFQITLGSGDAQKDKPEPDPLLKALEYLNIRPSKSVWMIGDTPADWLAATTANCHPINVSPHDHMDFKHIQKFSSCKEILTTLCLMYSSTVEF